MIVFLVLLVLVVDIVNCDVGSFGGYAYPQPVPPLQLDEPSTPPGIYLPPLEDEIFPPPAPIPTYLPPNIYPPLGPPPSNDDTIVVPSLPPLYQTPTPQLRVVNMSCAMDNFFRSVVQIDGRTIAPVLEDAPEGCLVPGSNPSIFRIQMEGVKMSECGVRRCSGDGSRVNMCVTVRMPTVRNLKLPEDGLVTLQCAPQDNVVSHVKHLRLGANTISNNVRGRANNGGNVIATGGSQRNFNTRVSLLRKSAGSNNFDQVIQPGSNVQLGEELVLRAAVQDGDGWQYSRMGAVMVRSSSSQQALKLVEENGCRSPGLRNICPQHPRQVSPLTTFLNFRAFLFQGANKGDEMLLSVRMLGCLHPKDCFQRSACEDPGFRTKRESHEKNKNYTKNFEEVANWESFQFRVVAPSSTDSKISNSNPQGSAKLLSVEFIAIITSVFGLVLVCFAIIIFVKRKKVF